MFGFIWNAQLTAAEVSDQIQREAPWNRDKATVEREIGVLQASNTKQALQISQLQTQVRFFCATRTKAGLPGC
jgi:cell division protein FtsB